MKSLKWLIILILSLTLTSYAYSATLYQPKDDQITGDALTQAYSMKLEYYKAKISYETAENDIRERLKEKNDQIARDFWIQITTLIVLGFVATN